MVQTLPEYLLHWAERTPDAIFVGEPDRGRTHPYGEIAGRVGRLRAKLDRLGVRRGDLVAILAENSCAWAGSYLGIMAHGAVAVPLNTRHVAGDLGPALHRCRPAAAIADPDYVDRIPIPRRQVLTTTELGATGPGAPSIDGSEARPTELGLVCFTSGTTGTARGVMIHHEAVVRSGATFAQLFQSGPDSRTAVVCPLFHNTGYIDGLAHMLLANGRVDVPRRFDPEVTARALLAGAYSFLIGVPTMYGRMLPALSAAPPPADLAADLAADRATDRAPWLAHAGAPLPGALA